MSGPVNQIKLIKKQKTDFYGSYELFIDRKNLLDQINEFELQVSKTPWKYRSQCILNMDELKKSSQKSGLYSILICAGCASQGHLSCRDIGLSEFKVTHKDSLIIWEISLADWVANSDTRKPLILQFDYKQYQNVLSTF